MEQKREWKSTYKKLLKLDSKPIYNKPKPINKDDSINKQENNVEETGLKPIALVRCASL